MVREGRIKSYRYFSTSLGEVALERRKLAFTEDLPQGWGVLRSGGWPCNSAVGIVRSADVRGSPPTAASGLQAVRESPGQTPLTVGGPPYASTYDPKSVRSVTYDR